MPNSIDNCISLGNVLVLITMLLGGSAVVFTINVLAAKNSVRIDDNTSAIERNINEIEAIRKEVRPIAQDLQNLKIHFKYQKDSMSRIERDLDFLVKAQRTQKDRSP